MELADFVADILTHPADDTPRLIFADWLDERGDPRGEFIRVQCELAQLSKPPKRYGGMYGNQNFPYSYPEKAVRTAKSLPRFKTLLSRQVELLKAHCGEWTAPFGTRLTGGLFCRGFLEGCSVRAATYIEMAPQWYQVTPLRQLAIRQDTGHNNLKPLWACPFLEHVDTLELGISNERDALLFANCPYLVNLRQGYFGFNGCGEKGIRAILDSPYLQKLTDIGAYYVDVGPALQSAWKARFGKRS